MVLKKMNTCILLVLSFLMIILSTAGCSSAASSVTTSTTATVSPTLTEASPTSTSGWDAAKVISELAKIPNNYSSEQAIKDGCYVYGMAIHVQNQVAIEFIQKAETGENASLRMIGFTIEGDPIITQIDFIDQTFHVLYDTSRDNFGNYGVQEFSYLYLETYEDNGQKVYFLVNDQALSLAQINDQTENGHLAEFAVYRLPFIFE